MLAKRDSTEKEKLTDEKIQKSHCYQFKLKGLPFQAENPPGVGLATRKMAGKILHDLQMKDWQVI